MRFRAMFRAVDVEVGRETWLLVRLSCATSPTWTLRHAPSAFEDPLPCLSLLSSPPDRLHDLAARPSLDQPTQGRVE